MPAPNENDRRFTLALTAAVAATTVAIGVTAATLLGWIRTSEPPQAASAAPTEPALVYVPIAPTSPPAPSVTAPEEPRADRVAMEEGRHDEHEGDHDEREDDDD